MGSEVERFLTRTEPQVSPLKTPSNAPPSETETWLRSTGPDRLNASVQLADPTRADESARVKFLQEKTGLPPDLISRNLPEVTRQAVKADFNPESFQRNFPHTANWLAEQPEHADIAWEDLPHLSGVEGIVEKIIAGATTGWRQSKQGRIGYDIQQDRGRMTDEQNTELAALNADIKTLPNWQSYYSGAFIEFGRVLGQMAEGQTHEAGQYGVSGATAGAVAGIAGALILGPAAIPAAAVIGGGLAVGSAFGWAEYTRRQESGQAYMEMSQMRDEKGNPYPEDQVNKAAQTVGMINALFEMGGTAAEVTPFAKAFKKFTRKSVQDALVRPTMAKALVDLGSSYALALAGETGTEVAQELSNVYAEEWIKTGKAKFPETPEEREAAIKRLTDIARMTAAGMSLMAVPGAATHGAATAVEARQAVRMERVFKDLGNQVQNSETYKKLPSSVQSIVASQTKDGPLENLYIPAETWNTYWQGKEADPAKVAEHVTGDRQQYEEAVKQGGDIVIPTARYAVTIAPTEHNSFFAQELRTGPNQMSAREAKEAISEQERQAAIEQTEAEKQRAVSAEEVTGTIEQMLLKAGYGAGGARLQAESLYGRVFKNLAERSGLDPKELFERYKISVERLIEDNKQANAHETVLSQDDIVKQFMAWSAVRDDPNIAQPLRDLAFMKARDLEGHARAIHQGALDAANVEYKERTGQDWTYSQPTQRVPAHVTAALDAYVEKVRDKATLPEYGYTKALAAIARNGTFDDVNVFMAQLGSQDVDETGQIGAAIIEAVPEFKTWLDDMLREPPKLELLQSAKKIGLKAAVRTFDGKLFTGVWHGEATQEAIEAGYSYNDLADGFVTKSGKFFSREQATEAFGVSDTVDLDFAAAEPFRTAAWKALDVFAIAKNHESIGDLSYNLHNDVGYAISMMAEMGPGAVDDLARDIPAFKKWLEMMRRGGETEYLQSAVPPHLLPGFHSKAERLIEQKMPARATVADVRGILKDIKAEERKWLGLDEQLAAWEEVGNKLTKEDVLFWMRANRLEIEELENTGTGELTDADENARAEAAQANLDEMAEQEVNHRLRTWYYVENIGTAYNPDYRLTHSAGMPEETISTGNALQDNLKLTASTLAQARQLAKSRIMEHLTRLDESGEFADTRYGDMQDTAMEDAENTALDTSVAYEDWTLPGGDNYRILAFRLPRITPPFTGTHEGVSTESNVFAHTRLKDRVGPNGEKILFVEEIQSDWHQQGRERGYDVDTTGWTVKWNAPRGDNNGWWTVINARGVDVASVPNDLAETAADAIREGASPESGTGVPDAPFRNTWHEFVFKRLLRLAAEGGYDQVAWTTGEQQNERYNLEKHVEEIRVWESSEEESGYAPDDPNRLIHLEGYNKIGTGADYGRLGPQRVFSEAIPLSKLGDYIGKELAVRLMTQPQREGRAAADIKKEIFNLWPHLAGARHSLLENVASQGGHADIELKMNALPLDLKDAIHKNAQLGGLVKEFFESYDNRPGIRTLKGEEMRVGGQGMRGFYDDILVRFANNFGKKYKTQHGSISLEVATGDLSNAPRSQQEAQGLTQSQFEALQEAGILRMEVHGLGLSDELKQAALQNEFTLYQSDKSRALIDMRTALADAVVEMENLRATVPEDMDLAIMIGEVKILLDVVNRGSMSEVIHRWKVTSDEAKEHLEALAPEVEGFVGDLLSGRFGSYEQEARGRIRIGAGGLSIEILKKADPSTFIHETGHAYLEILHDLAGQEKASADIISDYNTIRRWLGASATQEGFTREQHEMFARGFEAYLMEGRAPVKELQSTFLRFKVWLLSVYQSVKELNVTLTDDVRRVFDRMLASSQEIDAAQHALGMEPLFLSPELVSGQRAFRGIGGEKSPTAGLKPNELGVWVSTDRKTAEKYGDVSEFDISNAKVYDFSDEKLNKELGQLFGVNTATPSEALVALDEESDSAKRMISWLKDKGFDAISVPNEESGVFFFNKQALKSPSQKWMSKEQAAEYSDAAARAQRAAEEDLTSRIMKEWRDENSRVLAAKREEIRGQVLKEADDNRVVRARSILSRGRMPSGAPLPDGMKPFKLSRNVIQSVHGEKVLNALPKPLVWTRDEKAAMHPDLAADLLGFSSGQELVKALLSSTDPDKWINDTVKERMRGQTTATQMLTAAELPVEAVKAAHNEKRAQLLHKEMQILASQNLPALKGMIRKMVQRIPTLKDIREQAQELIAGKVVRSINPLLYQRAEQTAAKEALEQTLKGDFQEALTQKQRQLLNHELYRAARDSQEEVARTVALMQSFDKKSTRDRIGRAGGSYLEQIDALRERFSFTPRMTVERKESLRQFIQDQESIGLTPDIPDKLKDEAFRKDYRELTLQELRDVRDAAKRIRYFALLKNKLLAAVKKRRMDDMRNGMIQSIKANHKLRDVPFDRNPNLWKRLSKTGRGWVAAHTKMEFLFEWLDGNTPLGPVWTALFKPIADAENAENAWMRKESQAFRSIFGVYSKSERALWFLNKEHTFHSGSFTKSQLLTMALNWGNEYNRAAMMEGEHWNEGQAQDLLDRLDDRDWDTVQAIWDHLETFWPYIARLERELTGQAPERVEPSPFTTKSGKQMRGGYYPIVFDRDRSMAQAAQDAKETVRNLYGGQYARAMTKHGHTIARSETGGKPIRLDLTGLTEHVTNVVHDLTHRRAVIDVERLTNAKYSPEVAHTIQQAVGTEMYKQIQPWLVHIASRKSDFVNLPEKFFGRMRLGATVVNLGLKFTTSVVQFLGATGTIKEIGSVAFMGGVNEVYGKPWKFKRTWDFVSSRSEFMKDRLSNYDRDINDTFRRLNIAGTGSGPMSVVKPYTVPIRDSFFLVIGLFDMGVSLPSWMGAYQKAMDGKVKNLDKGDEQRAIDYADQVIRETQGVGNAKDLAAVQRGPESWKIFAMFYTYMSGLFNQFAKTTNQLKLDKNAPRFIASMAMLWFVPAILQELVLGRAPDPDDDPDKWLKWLAKTELLYPLQTIIIIRDIVDKMVYDNAEPSAVFDAYDALAKAAHGVAHAVTGEEVTRAEVKGAVQALGYVTHLPTKQAWLTTEYFFDWWQGNTEEESPADMLWHGLVTGKPKENQ